ncbi:MAG: SDR family NAD(P)-dependent oxidoreductase [Anaerolineales bacterium]
MSSDYSKVALIVGAGSSLGQQIARGLARAGLRVALNDLLPNHIESLATDLGEQAAAYPIDPSRKLGLQTMLQSILETWQRIDVLVFIPTAQSTTPLLDLDEWDWHRSLDLNLTTAFLCMQSVGRVMRELGGGIIVNVLPEGTGASAVYTAAASGLAALSEAAAAEFSAHNIQVHFLAGAPANLLSILQLCAAETETKAG